MVGKEEEEGSGGQRGMLEKSRSLSSFISLPFGDCISNLERFQPNFKSDSTELGYRIPQVKSNVGFASPAAGAWPHSKGHNSADGLLAMC